jgi:putative FmdB family regulatory protein
VPLHEYRCKKCQHTFEKISKFSDPPVKKCPKCGGPVEQLLSAPAVQFKGSGWYVTDYARKGASAKSSGSDSDSASSSTSSDKDAAAKDAGAKDGASKSGEKSESKKTTTKTETKTEPKKK